LKHDSVEYQAEQAAKTQRKLAGRAQLKAELDAQMADLRSRRDGERARERKWAQNMTDKRAQWKHEEDIKAARLANLNAKVKASRDRQLEFRKNARARQARSKKSYEDSLVKRMQDELAQEETKKRARIARERGRMAEMLRENSANDARKQAQKAREAAEDEKRMRDAAARLDAQEALRAANLAEINRKREARFEANVAARADEFAEKEAEAARARMAQVEYDRKVRAEDRARRERRDRMRDETNAALAQQLADKRARRAAAKARDRQIADQARALAEEEGRRDASRQSRRRRAQVEHQQALRVMIAERKQRNLGGFRMSETERRLNKRLISKVAGDSGGLLGQMNVTGSSLLA